MSFVSHIHPSQNFWPFEFLRASVFNFEGLDILCAWINIRVKFYDHLNFSRASVVQFRASRYIMGLTYTPESKVMAIGIFWELPCTISRVLIYYDFESDIPVNSFDHLNFLISSIVHFRASRYMMGLTHTPESKVMVIWICRELTCSISSVSIYYASESKIQEKKWWPFEILESFRCSFFENLDISFASHLHPSQKLRLFEFAESFRVQFQASRYIMSLN